MSKRTRLVGTDAYEGLASAYQLALASMLDQALRESGISLKRKRRQICDRFLRAHGTLHDQCWLRNEGKTVYPMLGFAEVFQNVGMSPQQLGAVVVDGDRSFSFEEYVWSVLRCHFEPDPADPAVEVGFVGEEGAEGDGQKDEGRKKKPGRQ